MNIREWKFWDWVAAISLGMAAIIPALEDVLKNAPNLLSRMPGVLESPVWSYLPLLLVLLTVVVVTVRQRSSAIGVRAMSRQKAFQAPDLLDLLEDSRSEFKLLPQQFVVDLSAQLPYVEIRFFAVNFLTQRIVLSSAKLSLRLGGGAPLEAIPLMQEDCELDAHQSRVVICRRNLSDSELGNLPWMAGWQSGSFELLARATTGDKALTYGPVSAMVVDGWVQKRTEPPKPKVSDRI
jgi:hypothetical protein